MKKSRKPSTFDELFGDLGDDQYDNNCVEPNKIKKKPERDTSNIGAPSLLAPKKTPKKKKPFTVVMTTVDEGGLRDEEVDFSSYEEAIQYRDQAQEGSYAWVRSNEATTPPGG